MRAKFELCTGVDEAGEDVLLGLAAAAAADDFDQSVPVRKSNSESGTLGENATLMTGRASTI